MTKQACLAAAAGRWRRWLTQPLTLLGGSLREVPSKKNQVRFESPSPICAERRCVTHRDMLSGVMRLRYSRRATAQAAAQPQRLGPREGKSPCCCNVRSASRFNRCIVERLQGAQHRTWRRTDSPRRQAWKCALDSRPIAYGRKCWEHRHGLHSRGAQGETVSLRPDHSFNATVMYRSDCPPPGEKH